MENMTCELNGIKYLLVDQVLTGTNPKKITEKIKKYEAIVKDHKREERGGFFSSTYVIITVLVPEKHIMEWNNETLK